MAEFTPKNWLSVGETGANDNNSIISKDNLNDLEKRIAKLEDGLTKKINNIDILSLPANQIQENDDLNNYTQVGVYLCNGATTASTLKNAPATSNSIKLIVEHLNMTNRVRQTAYLNDKKGTTYIRFFDGEWNPWIQIPIGLLNVPVYQISENADLNTYTKIGTYYSPSTAVSNTIKNTPWKGAFKLIVENVNNDERIRQTIYGNALTCDTYFRYYNGSWGSWYKVNLTAV